MLRLTSWRLFVLLGVIVVGAGFFLMWQVKKGASTNDISEQRLNGNVASLVDEATLTQLSKTYVSIDRSHLNESLTPPTNKWFSGFALQEEPKPGYNYPTSFMPREDGFEFGLPKVATEEAIIHGGHAADIVVTISDATSYKISYYDELVLALTYYDANEQAVATVRVASGLPYVYISAERNTKLHFNGSVASKDGWSGIKSSDNYYGINMTTNDNDLELSKGSSATFFSAPAEDSLESVAKHADAVMESGIVSYERRDSTFTTTFIYKTSNNEPVLFAKLPHHQDGSSSEVTYRSILGDMTTEAGTEFSFETKALPITDQLDLASISDDERELLVRQLKKDVTEFEDKKDTYFAGKQLYRTAQLLVIAEQLGEDEASRQAKEILKRELESWFTLGKSDPKAFLYESSMKGIVGNEASFGSDKEFNDHHFHYGYFIYAAAILAKYDGEFLLAHKNTVNLLAADIANYNPDEKLPLRRSFDPYAGHSWASGTSPFQDGNNQESTSEAINAWVGVSLWARQTDNKALEIEADWMLSQEYHTAQMYWLLQAPTPEYLSAYISPLASLVWGGKREYATFFSNEPNAKLAIQLIPLSPTIKKSGGPFHQDLFIGTSTEKIYGDHILMAQPKASLEQAVNLPDSAIDDGNSRTYLYAYILSK